MKTNEKSMKTNEETNEKSMKTNGKMRKSTENRTGGIRPIIWPLVCKMQYFQWKIQHF